MNLRSCLAAALLLALAAGCGSSSSSKGAISTPSATRPPSPVASASTPADSSTRASLSSSASAVAAAVSAAAPSTTSAAPVAAGNGSTADFCKAISTTEGILTTAATSPQDPTLPDMLKRLHTLAASAPSAIRVDLGVIADFDQKIVDSLASGKRPAIEETPDLKAAMLHEAFWVQKNCS